MKKRFLPFFATLSLAAVLAVGCDDSPKIYDPVCGEGYYVLTPDAPDAPRFNGADIFGVRPGSPTLYTIAATGVRPMSFAAENLPAGLSLDPVTGMIGGTITDKSEKTYSVTLTAKNSVGTATRVLDIVVGKDFVLTPPMGWSSWIAMKKTVSQAKVLANAKAMKELGLDHYGYNYVNIDDVWQGPKRGGKFNAILPDPTTFPDIKALSDEVHSMGYKFGIYSTPWITSYAGRIGGSSNYKDGRWNESMRLDFKNKSVEGMASRMGKYRFDENDAKQWEEWEIDYMKYDWNPNDSTSIVNMANALAACNRDIAFSISNSCPISEAYNCEKYVQVFRTNGDIRARWNSKREHINLCDNWEHHCNWLKEGYEGAPGHIPDPDFLMIGLQKYGSNDSLTVDELYHHMSSFVLWGGPLLVSCELSTLQDFELSLLKNVEILDLNQDRLAIPAQRVYNQDGIQVLVKPLANGDKAVGIFNFNDEATVATIDWATVGLEGKQLLRDCWRQKDVGKYNDNFSANIRPHGVVVVRASAL